MFGSNEDEEYSHAQEERQRLFEKRKKAVALRDKQMTPGEIAKALGVTASTVRRWLFLYDMGGLPALQPRIPPGRAKGSTFEKKRHKPRW